MSILLFFGHPSGITGTGATVQDEQHVFGTGPFFPIFEVEDAIIPAYPYQQYADDQDIAAFFVIYNTLAQIYLDWFNKAPLGVYTSPQIGGDLLDWIGRGVFGVPRPVFSTLATHVTTACVAGVPLANIAISGTRHASSGTAVLATDDYYKRTLTWLTYLGDGRFCSLPVLRKKIARFLSGINGSDITLAQAQIVDIAVGASPNFLTITIPTSTAAHYFQQALAAGTLTFPFQLIPTVVLV